MNRLIIFGCSHTNNLYTWYLKKYKNVVNRGVGGFSNMNIMKSVYNWVKEGHHQEGDVLLIQYTYTNRWWRTNSLPDSVHGFHSFDFESPIYEGNDFAKEELLSFYEKYLTYFWDYEPALEHHLQEIEMLQSFLKINNISFIDYAWTDTGNPDESKIGKVLNKTIENGHLFKELGCISIDGNFLVGHWAREQNLVDNTDHIRFDKMDTYGKIILDKVKEKFNIKFESEKNESRRVL